MLLAAAKAEAESGKSVGVWADDAGELGTGDAAAVLAPECTEDLFPVAHMQREEGRGGESSRKVRNQRYKSHRRGYTQKDIEEMCIRTEPCLWGLPGCCCCLAP